MLTINGTVQGSDWSSYLLSNQISNLRILVPESKLKRLKERETRELGNGKTCGEREA